MNYRRDGVRRLQLSPLIVFCIFEIVSSRSVNSRQLVSFATRAQVRMRDTTTGRCETDNLCLTCNPNSASRNYDVFTVTRDFPLAEYIYIGPATDNGEDKQGHATLRRCRCCSRRLINLARLIERMFRTLRARARFPVASSSPIRIFADFTFASTSRDCSTRNQDDTVVCRCLESDSPPPASLPIFSVGSPFERRSRCLSRAFRFEAATRSLK